MGTITYSHYSLSQDEFEEEVNKAKIVTLALLVNEGVITEEQFQEYNNNYAIILKKPSFFSKIWNKATKKEEYRQFIMVKQMNLNIPELEEKEKEKGAILSLVKDEDKDTKEE